MGAYMFVTSEVRFSGRRNRLAALACTTRQDDGTYFVFAHEDDLLMKVDGVRGEWVLPISTQVQISEDMLQIELAPPVV